MVRKWIKRVSILVAAILLLLVLFVLFLHTGWGRAIVRNKVQSYLHEKFKTSVSIGDIDYRLPDWIRLKNVLILDRQADTLLSGGDIYVKVSMLQMLSNKVEVGALELKNVSLHLRRAPNDSAFNHEVILDAFSSGEEVDADTASQSAPMQLSVDRLSLNEVSFNISDKKGRQYFSASVKKLSCSARDLDLEKSSFGINELAIAGVDFTIVDSTIKTPVQPVAASAQTTPSPLSFALKKLGIRDAHFSYKSIPDKLHMSITLNALQVDEALLDIANQTIGAKKVMLNNSAFNYAAWMESMSTAKEETPPATTNSGWKLNIDAVALSNNAATYHNTAAAPINGFDVNHLDVKKINFFSRQNKLEGSDIYAIIDSCSLVMNDRFDLKQVKTKAAFTGNSLQTEDLFVAFNGSYINADGKLNLPSSIATNQKDPQQYHLKNAVISYADVLAFAPSLTNTLPIALSPYDKIIMSGNFIGSLQDFSVQNLNLATNNKLLQLKGKANYRSNESGIKYAVVLDQLNVQKSLLSPSLLQELQKQDIQLPSNVSLSGNLSGSADNNITADLRMNSDYGQLLVKGSASKISNMQRINYSVDLDTRNLETGKWIGQQTTLGKLDGKIHIKGVGIQPGKMNTSGNMQLRSFVLNGYKYVNIQLTGGLTNADFTAKGFIDDPNLETQINLRGNLSNRYPSVNGSVGIEKADLKELLLSEDSIVLATRLLIDVTSTNTGGLSANIYADSNRIVKNGKAFFVDSISIAGYSEKNESSVVVNAPFINATVQTNYELTELPDNINHLRQQLFNLEGLHKLKSSNQSLSVNATVTQHELLSTWFPALKLEKPLAITVQYNGVEKDSFLFVQLAAPSLQYRNLQLEGLSVKVKSIDSAISFSCYAERLRSGMDTLLHPSISGRLQNKMLTVAARIEDNKGKEYFALKASAEKAGETTVFRFLDDLTINRRKWEVPAGNSVVLQKEGIVINDLSIANAGQVLYIKTRDTTATSPVDIKIDSIDIGHMAAIASFGDTTVAGGKLSATVSIQQPINSWTAITGTINLNDLVFQKMPVGDVQIHTSMSGDSLQVNGSITGNNSINFAGNVHLADGGLDATASLEKINMALVQGLAKDFLSRCSGIIKGDFRFTGNISKPQINGAISFDSTVFALKELNALYGINGQQLKMDFPELKFDHFTISDSLKNSFTIDGAVNMSNVEELGLKLQAQTKNFIVLNAPRRPGSSLYGAAIIDAAIKIDGTSNEPVIDGQISINNKSRIHYLLQSGSDYTQKAKGGIRFVDMDTIPALQAEMISVLQDTGRAVKKLTGMKYNLILDLSKDAEFRIVVNPAANDELVMKGEAHLNTGMDEGGDIAITGVYRLESGYYNMNNQFLREKFMLVKGSTITFIGDPYNAVADIKTEYEVQASSAGLLRVDEKEYPDVSKRLPYQVVLNIKGPISKPELTFDIKLKDNVPGITASMRDLVNDELSRLRTDVSELNKQVFSLLVMSRFTVTSNDDVAGGVLDVDAAVKDGVSSFLSQAMNQMADDLIKGVDIEVTMKNYETSNSDVSKTDVGVAMSKDLFKDRLQVTIGKNFSMGETNTTYQNNAQQYVPDITTAYKLSKDGRYLLKAYHKNEYSAAVEGYFAETGVSFTIEFDYNKFKELFYSSKKLQNK